LPFLRPSLTALQAQSLNDYTSSNFYGQLLSKSVLRVIAMAQAGLAFLHYGYLDWIAKQSVPFTADGEYLEAWAGLKNVIRESPTSAKGSITVVGTNLSVLPGGTILQTINGTQYSVDNGITISGTTGTGTITAVVAASAGNSDSGIPLTCVTTISGITSIMTTSALIGGSDIELTSSLRNRMLTVYQNPPQGGSTADYIEWALATPGVTRAWCNPLGVGIGTVVVYVMFDITEASHSGFPVGTNGGAYSESRITPATGDQAIVANYIFPLRPVTAIVYVAAPIAYPINITIANLTPGGSLQITGIPTAISNRFVQIGNPLGMTLHQSDISGPVEGVIGVTEFDITVPASPITIPIGSIPTLGTITYV
jgi:uncharacterized phage protein gp47/JayE